MNWHIKVAKRVLKQMKRLPKKDVTRLSFALKEFADNPFRGDIARIEGEKNVWRRRIGNYRILYEVCLDDKVVSVFDARRRTSKTYK